MFAMTSHFVKGLIVQWYGSIASIPNGWVLCDGNNGTPDLRDKFVVGAGSTYNPAASGGATTHAHPFTSLNHSHNEGSLLETDDTGGYECWEEGASANRTVSGTTDSVGNLPPYYALAYIMRTA